MKKNSLLCCMLFAAGIAAAQDLELAAAADEDKTNVISNVQTVRSWKRYFVLGEANGTLKDASKTIADYLSGETLERTAEMLPQFIDAAHEGLTNALSTLYAVTNRVNDFTDRIYIAGDLEADDIERANFWTYIAAQSFDDGEDIFDVWFSSELHDPPRMTFRYSTDIGVENVAARWENWQTTRTVSGFENCHRCYVERPAFAAHAVMKANAYPRIGHPSEGFDWMRKTFFLTDEAHSVTNVPWTGLWTNSNNQVLSFINGIYVGVKEQ